VSGDTLRATLRRAFGLQNRRIAVRPGRLDRIAPFTSRILGNGRQITIYVPAGYDERPERRYPVLYMHDGQNLFDADRAFIPGQHWRLSEAADSAIGERTAEPAIIVGIDNGGAMRIDEYTPTRDPDRNMGGRAQHHAQMIMEEIKPMIDARYRTFPDAANTGIGGASLGGLVSLHLALKYPTVFGRVAAMSPSVWWHNRVIVREVDDLPADVRPRVWLDIGGREGAEALDGARTLRDTLKEHGWNNQNFRYHEDRRGDHSERSWATRARMMLEFLFPPQ
jgi:predicted alpha/beta superfamily hydrolase